MLRQLGLFSRSYTRCSTVNNRAARNLPVLVFPSRAQGRENKRLRSDIRGPWLNSGLRNTLGRGPVYGEGGKNTYY